MPDVAQPEATPAPDVASEPAERRTFWLYALALPLLAVGATWFGLIGTSLAIALLICWLAEGRPLKSSITFGLVCGLVGVVGFSLLLDVNVPQTEVERTILRALR